MKGEECESFTNRPKFFLFFGPAFFPEPQQHVFWWERFITLWEALFGSAFS
jgi:hypothetical protein